MGCNKSTPEPPPVSVSAEAPVSAQTSAVKKPRRNLFGAIQADSITEYYEIIKATGSAKIGTYLYAKHIRSQEFRTLREINKLTIREEALYLSQEVNILKDVESQYIRRVYECIETPKSIYIAMESIEGLPLNKKITNPGCETLMYKVILEIFTGLDYLHSKGIAHCNICPDFVIQIEKEGYNTQTKLVGFQAAQRLNDKQEVVMKKIKYQYASPELLRGDFDEKTDLWSCGILLYDILLGKLPYIAKTKFGIIENILKGELDFTTSLFTSLSNSMQHLIRSLLEVDPSKRLTTKLALSDPNYSSCIRRIQISLEALSKLRKFQVFSAAARSMLALLMQRFQKEDHEIVVYFKELDENFDGKVSKDELLEAYIRLGINISEEADRIMANMDLGGNGFIDYTELKVSLINWNEELKQKNLTSVLTVEDGKIRIDVLRFDLIDVKRPDWNQFLKDCPNDGTFIKISDLKRYLRANVVQ